MRYKPYSDQHDYNDGINSGLIIGAFGQWVEEHFEQGWKAYILTFMFNQLRGSAQGINIQMEKEVERVYATSLSRIIRSPLRLKNIGVLPKWVVSPDFPVSKYTKKSLRDVTINGGMHMHGIALMPARSRLRVGLDEHFAAKQALYVRPHSLSRIHVEPITHESNYVTDYVFKALKTGRVDYAQLMILPRSISELTE